MIESVIFQKEKKMTQTIDQQIKIFEEKIQKLRVSVQETKDKIETKWKTTTVFSFNNYHIQLRALKKDETIAALGLIISAKDSFDNAARLLNTKAEFKIGNSGFDDILFDFQKHIANLDIREKEKLLSTAEAKLDSIMSEEAKKERVLQQIAEDFSHFE